MSRAVWRAVDLFKKCAVENLIIQVGKCEAMRIPFSKFRDPVIIEHLKGLDKCYTAIDVRDHAVTNKRKIVCGREYTNAVFFSPKLNCSAIKTSVSVNYFGLTCGITTSIPGSYHDFRIFGLYEWDQYIREGELFLGDTGYRGAKNGITTWPYPSEPRRHALTKLRNSLVSNCRLIVENSFGRLTLLFEVARKKMEILSR
ncbi:hypothetical protein EIN_502120 [Entamoeba invadens IP1]|uniref:DDE Tnp4 domain-containing protein n=1 Tax=Entamoeba invadens IP1 TaxID=370355 RepID=A0A0A1TZN8_ENTIV|nr:hypothetical protein EIN_502120 [Entamoeba invadens IP1]ELP84099.1 hypothetical protein EIN_502120 [Entamoeba invadens IP1]|eukprot:XP_004183445.1 hypothetical protein EIN_502120 [Entamoeba invadens IP1]